MNAQGNLGITIVPAKDTGETFLMVESGRVAGTMNDDGLAYGSVASSKDPSAFVIGTRAMSWRPTASCSPRTTRPSRRWWTAPCWT